MTWLVFDVKTGKKVARLDDAFSLVDGTPNAKKLFASRPAKLFYLGYQQGETAEELDGSFGVTLERVDTQHVNYDEALMLWLADYGLILERAS